MAQLCIAHVRLFGVQQGSKIFGASLGWQADPQFLKGRREGGNEATRWLSSGCKDVPMGLVTYLCGDKG